MRVPIVAFLLLAAAPELGQAVSHPSAPAPTLEEVRKEMGIPTEGNVRGQLDTVGFASRADQMAAVWDLSSSPPAPESLGPDPAPGVLAVVAPHDDYLYAGRVYRRVLPLVAARTVVVVGVFHGYRRFGVRDRVVFDPYPAWRAPDGEVPVSPLREEILAALPAEDREQDAAMHDAEHSVEALVYWLRHRRPDLEIVPVLVPAARFDRLREIADRAGSALAAAMKRRGLALGTDVAIAISTDGVHYGADFGHVPFGDGGIEAYASATARDREILAGKLSGPLTVERLRSLYETFADPADPDRYRIPWCGRFSIPFGLLLARRVAVDLGLGEPRAVPLAYSTSVGAPELPVRGLGLGETAPANLYHFVGYPSAAVVAGRREPGAPGPQVSPPDRRSP